MKNQHWLINDVHGILLLTYKVGVAKMDEDMERG